LIFTYLIPWGVDKQLDKSCELALQLHPPSPEISFAIKGHRGKMSLLVPSAAAKGLGRWQFSHFLTALHTLSAVTYTKHLMSMEILQLQDFKNCLSHLLSFYCTILPESLPKYVDPAMSFLALYWRDPMDDLMQGARSIFLATADRLTSEKRAVLAKEWAHQLKDTNPRSKTLAILVLGILGGRFPDALDTELTAEVSNELQILLTKERDYTLRIAAAELIGKGFPYWKKHIKDVDGLIQQLFALSLLSDSAYISSIAHHSLMLIGAAEPRKFVIALGKCILEVHVNENLSGKPPNVSQHAAAITTLGSLIKQDPCSLLPVLPRLVETVVRSLDPHVPYLKESCFKSTTKVLHTLVTRYPMVSFHQDTQRLAVGTKDSVIVIYDLNTATRWHVLEGHKKSISAVAFSDNGKNLASYSVEDSEVRIWQTTSSFFGILGSHPHCIQNYKVNPVERTLTSMTLLEQISLKWTSLNTVALVRAWEGSLTLKM